MVVEAGIAITTSHTSLHQFEIEKCIIMPIGQFESHPQHLHLTQFRMIRSDIQSDGTRQLVRFICSIEAKLDIAYHGRKKLLLLVKVSAR